MKYLIIKLIKLYQFFSKHGNPSCRFYPSCSQYTIDALEKHGLFKGLFKGAIRVSKCHPYHPGGIDHA